MASTCTATGTRTAQKAALIAHAGPWVAGGVVLSGHSDVVPVDGQAWTSDPWTVTERDGRLYGRGTCDMKGYVALAVWALVEAQAQGRDAARCNWRCPMTRRSAAPARRR